MILKWVVIGKIDNIEVMDTFATVLHNDFKNEKNDNIISIYHCAFTSLNETIKLPIGGLIKHIEMVLTIAINKHINEIYTISKLYIYKVDGTLKEVDITDFI